jgi:hypothetical protein
MMELHRPSVSAIPSTGNSANWPPSLPVIAVQACPSIGLKVAETYKLELVVL